MIKKTKRETGALAMEAEDIKRVAAFRTDVGDTKRRKIAERMETIDGAIRSDIATIERRKNDIEELDAQIVENRDRYDEAGRALVALPRPREVPESEARADVEKVAALPFIKSVCFEEIGGAWYIVATTRENSLTTTLDRKYSRAERWYKAKPYTIALPAYRIRFGLAPFRTCATNDEVLGLSLMESEDTVHFLEWIRRYSREPHPHWGTTSGGVGAWRGVCLGEYEGEVSAAFRRNLTDGFVAFAVYLQTAGAENAYVHTRHEWALWLGKADYNRSLMPSEREVKKLVAEEEENDCSCRDDAGDIICDEDCGCHCHVDTDTP